MFLYQLSSRDKTIGDRVGKNTDEILIRGDGRQAAGQAYYFTISTPPAEVGRLSLPALLSLPPPP